jgi:S-adenosylmethionine/arginine decarboxylase-like enzyme
VKTFLIKVSMPGPDTSPSQIMDALYWACDESGAHVRKSIEHKFYPMGFSAGLILAESHVTVHTWPEENIAYIDYFSCAEDPREIDFVRALGEKEFKLVCMHTVER